MKTFKFKAFLLVTVLSGFVGTAFAAEQPESDAAKQPESNVWVDLCVAHEKKVVFNECTKVASFNRTCDAKSCTYVPAVADSPYQKTGCNWKGSECKTLESHGRTNGQGNPTATW